MGSWVLVGGLGFLGFHFARRLLSAGWRVCVAARSRSLERRTWLAERLRGAGAEIVVEPALDAETLDRVLRGCSASRVAYLAGRIAGSPGEVWDAHVGLLERLLEALRGVEGVESLVYVSAVAAMGDASACERGGVVVEEERHLEGCRPEGVFEESKAEGERRVLRFHRETGLPVAVLRPVAVYGEYGYHPEWRLLYSLARHGIALGLPINTVYAGDVAEAALFASEPVRARGKWYIVARPEHLAMEKLSRLLIARLGKSVRADAAPLVKAAARLLGPLAPEGRLKTLYRMLRRRHTYHPRRLLEEGFRQWTPLDTSVAATLEWMRSMWS